MSYYSEIDMLQNHFKKHSKIREYQAHQSKVHSVGWSCDGRRLASGSFDKSVSIFFLERDRLVRILTFTSAYVFLHYIKILNKQCSSLRNIYIYRIWFTIGKMFNIKKKTIKGLFDNLKYQHTFVTEKLNQSQEILYRIEQA